MLLLKLIQSLAMKSPLTELNPTVKLLFIGFLMSIQILIQICDGVAPLV